MKLFKREKYLSRIRGHYYQNEIIKVITGTRRCGKSSLMLMIMDELIYDGVNEKQIVYINLDKRGYKNIKTDSQLEQVIDSLTKNLSGNIYLFIDEIQNVNNFESIIEAFRLEENFSIFITGSNSYLLSGELITKLTGRYIEFEIQTLSFDEYLQMKNFYNIPVNNDLFNELNNYIIEGGFPGSFLYSDLPNKRNYVKSIVNEIISKDIRKRIKIRKPETFNLVMNYVINNYGSTTSLNNILKQLNKNGFIIGKPTLLRYMQCLVDAKILYKCDRFDLKSRKMFISDKKYYLADLSLMFVTNPDSRINYGPALENLVYMYARSLSYEVYVGRIGKLECDFILKDLFLNYAYVQVCFKMIGDDKVEDREYKPLEMIKDNYPKYVLTTDTLKQRRNGIIHENICDFISNGKTF